MFLLLPDAFWDAAWLTAVAALITACAGAAGTILGNLHRDKKNHETLKRNSRVMEEVRSQVQNSHGTNLRDDLDKVVAAQGAQCEKMDLIHDAVKSLAHQLGETRRSSDDVHRDLQARVRRLEAQDD